MQEIRQEMQLNCGQIPTPIEGEGGGGQNQPVEFHFFFAWKPWDSDPTPRMEL